MSVEGDRHSKNPLSKKNGFLFRPSIPLRPRLCFVYDHGTETKLNIQFQDTKLVPVLL